MARYDYEEAAHHGAKGAAKKKAGLDALEK